MKKLLKIALMCFVFTFAIFGVACGEESSAGTNDPDYSTEEPASPEDNTPPDDNTSDDDDNTSDNENSNTDPDLPSDGGNETPPDETDPTPPEDNTDPDEEIPVDPDVQLATEIDKYLSKLVEDGLEIVRMTSDITTSSSHDNNVFTYTITFLSSEDYDLNSIMIDKTLFQSHFEKANLILDIDYNNPNVTLTYTKAEFLYPQISEYLSEIVTSKAEEMKMMIEMMFMQECNFSIIYRQNENTFQYTIAFNSEMDFDNAMMFFNPTDYQTDYDKVELSLNVDQSSPNIILSYTIVWSFVKIERKKGQFVLFLFLFMII